MALLQLARGLWTKFAKTENPFEAINGMEENLRLIDDHLGLYTVLPPQAPGTPFPANPANGDGQIYTDGSYAVFNAGSWNKYNPRLGLRVVQINTTEGWTYTPGGWKQHTEVDTAPAVAAAQAAVARAEAARDAAFGNANVYATITAGLAAVGDGQQFQVVSADGLTITRYRRDSATVAAPVAKYPLSTYIDSFAQNLGYRVNRIESNRADYSGAADLVPIYTDSGGSILIGVSKSKGTVFVSGALDADVIKSQFGEFGMAEYIGQGPVYPIATDAAGRVLLGVERSSGKLVGDLPESSAVAAETKAARAALKTPITSTAKNHLLFYGQSLSVGAAAGAVLSGTQPYANVTFTGGPRAWSGGAWDFNGLKPLAEDSVSPAPDGATNRSETVCSGAANYASTLLAIEGVRPDSHVILASTAGHGGYTIAQLNKTAPWYTNLMAHVSGAHALDSNHAVHAVGWIQGENDVVLPSSFGYYRSALKQLQLDIENDTKAITGQTHPVYMLTYQCSWGVKQNSAIALAQLDLAQKEDKLFLVTPTYIFPHAGDAVHLTAVGYKWLGAYFGRAYKSLVEGYQPQWLNPISATVRGAELMVRFSVPTGPLAFDQENMAPTTDYGFKVLSGATALTIASIKTDGDDVVITLSGAPPGAVTVRYALDYRGAGLTLGNGASGNLRDSTPDKITISGTVLPLWHACPSFELSATTLGE